MALPPTWLLRRPMKSPVVKPRKTPGPRQPVLGRGCRDAACILPPTFDLGAFSDQATGTRATGGSGGRKQGPACEFNWPGLMTVHLRQGTPRPGQAVYSPIASLGQTRISSREALEFLTQFSCPGPHGPLCASRGGRAASGLLMDPWAALPTDAPVRDPSPRAWAGSRRYAPAAARAGSIPACRRVRSSSSARSRACRRRACRTRCR
ncbi:hypothetical protein ATH84_10722 [Paracoccus versutus]|uniref:Uncharacterized protein n=1 Tax=Paracoccus versutus TaxID=34007 RepID=A0AAQ0KIR7_PARVE|nr:hypothetical protein ATH84_10722 [Paracoccus versutus]